MGDPSNAMEEEEDPVVQEVPVFLAKGLDNTLQLWQVILIHEGLSLSLCLCYIYSYTYK